MISYRFALRRRRTSRGMQVRAALCACCAVIASANARGAEGPEFKVARALSMGNAFVALAHSRDALHYNPAGLNLMGRAEKNTARLRDRVDARATLIGLHAPWPEAREGWGYVPADDKTQSDFNPWNDSTSADGLQASEETRDISAFRALEFAVHNFGIAYWGETRVEITASSGILIPEYHRVLRNDVVLQTAIAGDALGTRLSWGLGYRMVKRHDDLKHFSELDTNTFEDIEWSGHGTREDAQEELRASMLRPGGVSSFGHGMDFGLLWQQTPWLRLGAAAQNVGLSLGGKQVTPKVSVGVAANVPGLSTRGGWARTVNVAADYEDALNDRLQSLSKLNFGAEIDQRLGVFSGVGAAGGFKGGYWTAGLRTNFLEILDFELVSWAEEGGTFTGDRALRRYAMTLSVGI